MVKGIGMKEINRLIKAKSKGLITKDKVQSKKI